MVHYSWLIDSLTEGRRLDTARYFLPSGYSVLYPYCLFPNSDSDQSSSGICNFSNPLNNRGKLFSKYKVMNLAGEVWRPLLLSIGFTLVDKDEIPLTKLASLCQQTDSSTQNKIKHFWQTTCILVDVTQYQDSHSPSKRSKTGLTDSASLDIISWLSSLPKEGFGVITVDWLVNCLVVDERLQPNISELFSVPPDPIRRLSVYKQSTAAGGDRYSLSDIVVYRSSEKEHRQPSPTIRAEDCLVGSISAFTRRTETAPICVRIQPFQRGPGIKDLTPSDEEVLIDASMLGPKVSVFTRSCYFARAYAERDDRVFVMSEEWEEDMRYNIPSISSKSNNELFRQASQDF